MLRQKTIGYINEIIKNQKKSKIIEDSIYRYIEDHYENIHTNFDIENEKHIQKYIIKSKKILQNLKHLGEKIKSNELDFELKDIAFQSYISLFPDKWKNHIQKKEMNKQRIDTKPQATTDQFWCGKCHKNKTTYFELQTRGMDEPATVFITCIECGNKWRQG
jgi:DNA-directed RNA polymerase subunit M/transcription elongation factor TFIIS